MRKKIFNKIFRLAINQELLYHLPMQNNGPNHWSKSTTIPMALPPKNLCLELHKPARNAKKKFGCNAIGNSSSSGNVVNFNQMIRAIIIVVLFGISQLFSDELSTKNWIFGYPESYFGWNWAGLFFVFGQYLDMHV